MTTPGEVEVFCRARLDECRLTGVWPEALDFTSPLSLAAAWSDHPDYRPGWAPDAR